MAKSAVEAASFSLSSGSAGTVTNSEILKGGGWPTNAKDNENDSRLQLSAVDTNAYHYHLHYHMYYYVYVY